MEQALIIGLTAFVASVLAFFTGFGVGTLLLPVFALFFPVEIAVLLTAVVHLLNNIFKFILIGSHTSIRVALRFGIPAVAGAFIGAQLLFLLSETDAIGSYTFLDHSYELHPLKISIGLLIILFELFDLIPLSDKLFIKENHLIPGGFASGFFGGLSGHQGALRSAFLVKTGMTKEAFIATGATIAMFVDIVRIPVYFKEMPERVFLDHYVILIVAAFAALAGALGGRFLLKKIAGSAIRKLVSFAVILLGGAIASGLV